MDGLTVAQGEYEAELQARRDAEAEVTRLRILLNGQAARITAMSNDARKGELHKQLSRELSENLTVLERNLSRLRVERDVTIAEVEELETTRRCVSMSLVDTAGTHASFQLYEQPDIRAVWRCSAQTLAHYAS